MHTANLPADTKAYLAGVSALLRTSASAEELAASLQRPASGALRQAYANLYKAAFDDLVHRELPDELACKLWQVRYHLICNARASILRGQGI
jgi:hypothetical protein